MRVLEWREGKVRFLDQRELPGQEIWTSTDDPSVVIGAIQCSAIHGENAICAAAAYASVLAASRLHGPMTDGTMTMLLSSLEAIEECSPTTPGLVATVKQMRKILQQHLSGQPFELAKALLREAESMFHESGTRMRS